MSSTENEPPAPKMILGEVASSGLARGRALLCDCANQLAVPRRQIAEAETPSEIQRFDAAVVAVEQQLQVVQAGVRRTLGNAEAAIFEAQILLLRDEELRKAVREICVAKRINVEAALEEAMRRLAAVFDQLEDSYRSGPTLIAPTNAARALSPPTRLELNSDESHVFPETGYNSHEHPY